MAEVRALKEQKKSDNFPKDSIKYRGERAERGNRHGGHTIKQAGEVEKENCKKRERSPLRSLHGSTGPSHQQAKRLKRSVRLDGESEDAIADIDDDNAFLAFARAGSRPSRAAGIRASNRIAKGAGLGPDNDEEDSKEGEDSVAPTASRRRIGQRANPAVTTPKKRLGRVAAANMKGCRPNSEENENEDNADDVTRLESNSRAHAKHGKAGGRKQGHDVEMVDAKGSESSAEDEDEDWEARPAALTNARASRVAVPSKRPSRACAARAAERIAASIASASRKALMQKAAEWDDSRSDGVEEEDEDDDYDREQNGALDKQTNRKRRRDSGDSDDSDMPLVHDDSEDSKAGESSESSDEENEVLVRRGPARPRKAETSLQAPAKGKAAMKSGRGAKGKTASAPSTKAVRGNVDCKENTKSKPSPDGSSAADTALVEKILCYDSKQDMFLTKLKGVSYRRTQYMSQSLLAATKPQLVRAFLCRGATTDVLPEWLQVERVIAAQSVSGGRHNPSRKLLVKWRGLEYSDATWEFEEDLTMDEEVAAIERFDRINSPKRWQQQPNKEQELRKKDFQLPRFCSGCALRDYQEVSVRWMVNNYCQRRNCILGDEMGLGKTAQSIAVLEALRSVGGILGPFLIVAPLTTLGHWKREIETWTDMYVVHMSGSAADRAIIVDNEMFFAGSNGKKHETKFDVMLVSYETLRLEHSVLRSISWAVTVIDEAHRLKRVNGFMRTSVEDMDIDWLLLLTGTPVQNNMLELYSILSLLDADEYPSPEDFVARFGGASGGPPPTVEQIQALQAALAPILLRRMKEDVEDLPQKEEVIVWVELTAHQRAYYRAMYEGQISALMGGATGKNVPAMRNLAMELRKLCCHPALCEGLEEDLKLRLEEQRSQAPKDAPQDFSCPEVELLVRGSGKMVLLHKLLHKLREEGRRVLIFSQFVIMLNVLEDYCTAVGFPVERIDGSVTGRNRQQAIDRFTSAGEDSNDAFIFLLSTRAGGQGITLTAADTCIIYDSDWNPQNDLQAMARCHRIGQKKEVTVYRLISRDTYEMALFNTASMKYGLDEAILGFSSGSDPESDSVRIAELLRHGAHGLLSNMEAGLRQGEAFASEDINQILAGRTEKRQIGSRAGNTFSVATFVANDRADGGGDAMGGWARRREREDRSKGDAVYWRTLMPDAAAAHEARANEDVPVLGPRKRKQVNYNVNAKQYNPKLISDESSDDPEYEVEEIEKGELKGQEDGVEASGKNRKRRPRKQQFDESACPMEGQIPGQVQEAAGKSKARNRGWFTIELKALEKWVRAHGPGRWDKVYEQLQPFKYPAEEVQQAGCAMWTLYEIAAHLGTGYVKAVKKRKLAARDAMTAGAANEAPAAVAPAGAKETDADDLAPEAYEELLAHAILKKTPTYLHSVLSGLKTVQRLLREAGSYVGHGKTMEQLCKLMRTPRSPMKDSLNATLSPTAPAVGAGPGTGGGIGQAMDKLHACYLPPPVTATDFLHWWNRADDEALLMAVEQVGYVSGKPALTIHHALQNQPLVGRVVRKPEPKDQDESDEEGMDAEAGEAGMEGAAADDVRGGGSISSCDEVVVKAVAPMVARAPGADGPLELSADEWDTMVSVLSRRLNRLIAGTLDRHNRTHARSNRGPLPVSKPVKLDTPIAVSHAAPLVNHNTLPAIASISTHPNSVPSPPSKPTPPHTAALANTVGVVAAVKAAAVPVPKAIEAQAPKAVIASKKTLPNGITSIAGGRVGGAAKPCPVIVGGNTPLAQQQQHPATSPALQKQQHLRLAESQDTAFVEPSQRPQARQSGTTPAVAMAAGASKSHGPKQRTLPFARVGTSSSQAKGTAAGASKGVGKVENPALT